MELKEINSTVVRCTNPKERAVVLEVLRASTLTQFGQTIAGAIDGDYTIHPHVWIDGGEFDTCSKKHSVEYENHISASKFLASLTNSINPPLQC